MKKVADRKYKIENIITEESCCMGLVVEWRRQRIESVNLKRSIEFTDMKSRGKID